MDTESLKTLVEWYHNDEGQLIIITGTMIGLLGALAAGFYSFQMTLISRIVMGVSGSFVYLILMIYSAHISNRMKDVRERLGGLKLSDEQVVYKEYLSEIVGVDWHVLHPGTFVVIMSILYIGAVVAVSKKWKRTSLPSINTQQ